MVMKNKTDSTARHPFHSICSYLGCFPPGVARRLIERWCPQRSTILDPFCGSGTTLLGARLRGHRAIGVDLNPLGTAISAGKIQDVMCEDVLARIAELARGFSPGDDDNIPEGLRIIFHPRTLAQLSYLRFALERGRPEDTFILAAVLGIMHGKFRQDGTSAYLSIDMPNTFSMSPEYVRGFVKEHNLKQLPTDVFKKLRDRALWLFRDGPVPNRARAMVIEGDATRLPALLRAAGVRSVGAIITSPPYLGVLRYGAFNWIRLWMLNKQPAQVDRMLDGTDSLDRYLGFMASFLDAAAEVLPVGAPVVLVIGDVAENGQDIELAKRVWEELSGVVPYDLERIDVDNFDISAKTTRIWGEQKKGRATPVDRYLVLRRAARTMRRASVPFWGAV